MTGVSPVSTVSTSKFAEGSADLLLDRLFPSRGRVELDALIQDLYKRVWNDGKDGQVITLLRTCLPGFSYKPQHEVRCPVFKELLGLAEQVGFTSDFERAFIQYHEIGGEKFLFVAEKHTDKRFSELWVKLGEGALDKRFAIFHEGACRDRQSENDYLTMLFMGEKYAATGPWVFGLESGARPLQDSAQHFQELESGLIPKNGENKQSSTQEDHDTMKVPVTSTLRGFLNSLHINSPWDEVLRAAALKTNPLTKQATLLFNDIVEMLGTLMPLNEKWDKLYPILYDKHPVEAWRDLFLGLAMTCFKIPAITSAFLPSELALVKQLIAKPKDPDIKREFDGQIIIAMRDRSFARALVSAPVPPGTVRIAQCGYIHIPGVVRELERLAAAKK